MNYDTLDALYQHRDEASSMQAGFAQAPALAAQEPGDDPLRWGDRTHSHHGGRAERYEHHLGGNAKVVTFVTWTADRKKRHGE